MFEVSEQQFRDWGKKLKESQNFKKFWVFWSNYSTVLFIPGFVYLIYQKDWVLLYAFAVLAFALVRGVIAGLFAKHFPHQRPYQKFNLEPITSRFLSWKTEVPNGFPSRHIMSMSSVAGVAILFSVPVGVYFLLLTTLTGAGRVVLGFHFPKDVLYGLVIGFSASIVFVLLSRLVLFTIGG